MNYKFVESLNQLQNRLKQQIRSLKRNSHSTLHSR